MEIVFSINNNEKVMVLPVAPEWEISEDQANETFQGLTTNIRMIGNRELATISISSFFPSKRYPYLSPYADVNPWAYVAFFKKYQNAAYPSAFGHYWESKRGIVKYGSQYRQIYI